MNKILSVLFVLALLIGSCAALGEDLGVQPMWQTLPEPIVEDYSDIQLMQTYTVGDYAMFLFKEAQFYDYFAQFGDKEDYGFKQNYWGSIWDVYSYSNSDFSYNAARFNDAAWQESGVDAQFLWIPVDVTNLMSEAFNFRKVYENSLTHVKTPEIGIKVVYNDTYEFKGWIRQIDNNLISKDLSDYGVSRKNGDKADYPNAIVLNPIAESKIDPMYTGHYIFGCTLPNAVVEDKNSPLRVEITLGGSDVIAELIYNFRK